MSPIGDPCFAQHASSVTTNSNTETCYSRQDPLNSAVRLCIDMLNNLQSFPRHGHLVEYQTNKPFASDNSSYVFKLGEPFDPVSSL